MAVIERQDLSRPVAQVYHEGEDCTTIYQKIESGIEQSD